MRLRQSPVAVLLLVPAGVLAAHALGYAGAGHVHGGAAAPAHPHGYITVAAAVAAPLALLALLAGIAGAGAQGVSFRRMLALQSAVLLLQEGVEHVLAGQSLATLLLFDPLWLSLAAQLAAAAATLLLLRTARAVGARLLSLPGRGRLIPLNAGGAAVDAVALPPRPAVGRADAARAPPAVAA